MAKFDWERIKKQYVSEYAETSVSVKDFCVRNGLTYSTARKYLNNRLLEESGVLEQNKEQEHEQNIDDCSGGSDIPSTKSQHPTRSKGRKSAVQSRSGWGGKRGGAGAPKGNQNNFVHGLMTKAFGELVKYSHQVDDGFKVEVFKLAALQALSHYTNYKEELEEFIAKLPADKPPTEEQLETINRLENRINSSFFQMTQYTERLERLEGSMKNRNYMERSIEKTIAHTAHIKVDTKLKSKGIGLAEANTDKARAQTELAKHELNIKQREGLGNDDDLSMLLDEIQDMDDDEILNRFKENGGEFADDE